MYVIMRVNIIYILGTISCTINNTSLQIHKFDCTVGIKKGKDTDMDLRTPDVYCVQTWAHNGNGWVKIVDFLIKAYVLRKSKLGCPGL